LGGIAAPLPDFAKASPGKLSRLCNPRNKLRGLNQGPINKSTCGVCLAVGCHPECKTVINGRNRGVLSEKIIKKGQNGNKTVTFEV
jgi:hypothetical protein